MCSKELIPITMIKQFKVLVKSNLPESRTKIIDEINFNWEITRKSHDVDELYKEGVMNINKYYKTIDNWYTEHNLIREKDNEEYDKQILKILESALEPL